MMAPLMTLMSPDQHRRQAALLRRAGTPKAVELAQQHDNLARLIEARQEAETDPSAAAPTDGT